MLLHKPPLLFIRLGGVFSFFLRLQIDDVGEGYCHFPNFEVLEKNMAGVEVKPLKKVNKPYKIRREGSFVNGFRELGGEDVTKIQDYILRVNYWVGFGIA